MTHIELEDGKYTVIHSDGAGFKALRNGEEWRDLTGDGLVLAMAQEIGNLRASLQMVTNSRDRGRKKNASLDSLTGALISKNGDLNERVHQTYELWSMLRVKNHLMAVARLKLLQAQAEKVSLNRPQPTAWMYEHEQGFPGPVLATARWPECEHPWRETALFEDVLLLAEKRGQRGES